MTDPKYMRPGIDFATGKLVEELGELQAAIGKTMRWGRDSFNPELPPAGQEPNWHWIEREIDDVLGAIANYRKEAGTAALEQAGEPVADFYYPIEMPLTADGQGPATVGKDAASMTYEVWDQFCDSHGRFDRLSDAIRRARQLNALPTLQRLGQEFDAGEDKPVAYIDRAIFTRKAEFERNGWVAYDRPLGCSAMPLYAHPPQSRIAAERCRHMSAQRQRTGGGDLVDFCPDCGINKIPGSPWPDTQPRPQSPGQAFDGEGEAGQ